MNDVITVEETEMQIREYKGQRVVTLKDIDRVHGKKSDTAKKSFQKYKKHFILGEDYFEITRKELGERYSPNEKIIGNPNMKTYLLTESGYLMIVKAFTDDLSWKVQRQLVNGYFAARNMQEKHFFPKDRDWFRNNEDKINFICTCEGFSTKTLMHMILRLIGKTYYFDGAREQYLRETGKECATNSDVITYFDNIREEADRILQLAYEQSLGKVELTDMKQDFRVLSANNNSNK